MIGGVSGQRVWFSSARWFGVRTTWFKSDKSSKKDFSDWWPAIGYSISSSFSLFFVLPPFFLKTSQCCFWPLNFRQASAHDLSILRPIEGRPVWLSACTSFGLPLPNEDIWWNVVRASSLFCCNCNRICHSPFQSMLSLQYDVLWTCLVKGAVSRYSVIFCTFFLREQKMAAARASVADISLVSRANSFTAQAVSSNCCFPRPSLVAAIVFPHTKWLPKITDYCDTAALKNVLMTGVCCSAFAKIVNDALLKQSCFMEKL